MPRILLLDDDELFGKTMQREACRGHIDLTYWSTLKGKASPLLSEFDLIIVDFDLQNISGVQFAQMMHRYIRGIPIMLVSTYEHISRSQLPSSITNFFPKKIGPAKILEEALSLCC
jgi:two-component SAPR family response regulator